MPALYLWPRQQSQNQMNRACRLLIVFILLIACDMLVSCSNPRARSISCAALARYRQIKDWPRLPEGFHLGNPSGIGIDSEQNIIVFHRAGRVWPLILPMPESLITSNTIVILDRQSGRMVNSWGTGLFIMPHGLTVDAQDNIWVTDVGLHQVFKFSHEGRLLMRLGEAKVAGQDATHFNRPTDVAIAPDGAIYVSDGYRNSRIVKFSPDGKYLFEWGKKGDGPGEFDVPHSIDLDGKGNVYVADRENKRIQVFDPNGKFKGEWTGKDFGRICALRFDQTKTRLFAADYLTHYISPKGSDILVFDTSGRLLTRFGRSGFYDGPVCWYHDVAVDRDGNIYAGDILGNTLQKFIPGN